MHACDFEFRFKTIFLTDTHFTHSLWVYSYIYSCVVAFELSWAKSPIQNVIPYGFDKSCEVWYNLSFSEKRKRKQKK